MTTHVDARDSMDLQWQPMYHEQAYKYDVTRSESAVLSYSSHILTNSKIVGTTCKSGSDSSDRIKKNLVVPTLTVCCFLQR